MAKRERKTVIMRTVIDGIPQHDVTRTRTVYTAKDGTEFVRDKNGKVPLVHGIAIYRIKSVRALHL